MIIKANVISVIELIISRIYVNKLQHLLPSIAAPHDDFNEVYLQNDGAVLHEKYMNDQVKMETVLCSLFVFIIIYVRNIFVKEMKVD